ncbi:MAG: tRNA uridine(34) 5-carboxymethylaminomethyl modification radical SAM/GNAT enzyme Elp3 [Chloroflexi bacterium]|nr:tRNA uridine(34) 5-carboxymethylaminomethyl modification radical SAM/GNAT enzyme Elp3 [Chloroflexota bacterium]
MRKITRTISGVTPIAVMTEPMKCPGTCVYCPDFSVTPRSYTPQSPAVLRARQCGYDAQKQVQLRLRIFSEMGHPTDKVELIIMGGTFLAYPVEYQYRFIKGCYDALNGAESANLEEAKRINETARHRCTGLCIETRPDWCRQEEIDRMLEFGTTRVELGVQTLDDDIYRLVRRGHTVEDVAKATALLRSHGFKVYYHWMPGLPGATPEKDFELSEKLFDDDRFKPDGLKLYPTMVVEGTELERWYLDSRYQPYDFDTMVDLLAKIKSIVPKYVRIPRVLRDIPPQYITAGCKDSLRKLIQNRMKQTATECKCIRCREYGHRVRDGWEIGRPELVREDYQASGGTEIYLAFEDDKETLFGMLRMRVQPDIMKGLFPLGEEVALIRELHIFGPEVPLFRQEEKAAQHKGLGRALLSEAERIALHEFNMSHMAILSGVGAREYYRGEFGYAPRGDYMVKRLNSDIVPIDDCQRHLHRV